MKSSFAFMLLAIVALTATANIGYGGAKTDNGCYVAVDMDIGVTTLVSVDVDSKADVISYVMHENATSVCVNCLSFETLGFLTAYKTPPDSFKPNRKETNTAYCPPFRYPIYLYQ